MAIRVLSVVLVAAMLCRLHAVGMERLCPPSDEPRICGKVRRSQIIRLTGMLRAHGRKGLTMRWQKSHRYDNVNEDMAKMAGVKIPPIRYMSGSIDAVLKNKGDPEKGFRYGQWTLEEKVAPKFAAALGEKDPSNLKVGYWLSSAGIHAIAHYDESSNVFINLHGKKRFRFWSPEQVLAADLNPRMGPYERQLQKRTPIEGMTIELKRGDVMYIPPLWLHEPYTHTPCLSLSFTQEIPQQSVIRAAQDLELPSNEAWGVPETVSGFAHYMRIFAGGSEPLMAVAKRYGAKCQIDNTGPEDYCNRPVQQQVRGAGRAKNKLFMSIENPIHRNLALQDHAELVAVTVFGFDMAPRFFIDCFPFACEDSTESDKSEL